MMMGHVEGMDRNPQHQDHLHDKFDQPIDARVVVGVDGSETSWDAFCWACGETRRLGGRTVAVFVGPDSGATSATASLPGAFLDYGAIQQSMTDQATELSDQVRSYSHDHGVDVAFIHTRGDTARELLRIASAGHADLLVVGRSTKARHHLAGSLGRRLVGRSGAPIIVVVP
jgi:nucleotide-binding universal stress UspA family protein